jgi:hypothetical protein
MSKFSDRLILKILLVLAILYCCIEAMGDGDLYIYLCAAGKLKEGADIYTIKYINEQYQYYYSVLFAWCLSPFYSFPYYGVKLVWLLINLAVFIHLLYLLANAALLKAFTDKQKRWFLILAGIFCARFFHENMHASQITFIILWSAVYGLKLIFEGKELKGGALLALGINLKVLPILFVPYLIYRGYWKSTVWIALALLATLALPSLLIGSDYNLLLLKSWWQHLNPTNTQHVLDTDERSFHGLSTLLATLLVKVVPDPLALKMQRNVLDISYEHLALVLLSVRLLLLSFTLYFVRSWPFQKPKSMWQQCCEVSYLLMLIPLLFPHQQHYAFIFTCPAFFLVLYQVMMQWAQFSKNKKITLVCFISFIYLTANLKILLGEFNRYYEHYKILTYGALLLIPLLAWSHKEVLKMKSPL